MSAAALPLALAVLAGFCLGAAHFALLRAAVGRLTGGGSALGFAAGTALRLGLALGAVGLAVWLGRPGGELLAAALGFLGARLAATRWMGA